MHYQHPEIDVLRAAPEKPQPWQVIELLGL
jgi:hypothetical protein